jgi:hypothetical protein
MQQRLLVLAFGLSIAGGACAQGPEPRHARVSNEPSATSTTSEPVQQTFSNAPSAAAPASAPPPASAVPQPTAVAPAPPAKPECPLVCHVANRGRVPAADETRLSNALAGVTNALHACVRGAMPTMTLRFDSQGSLTYFGVDEEGGEDGVSGEATCVEAARRQKPAVTFAGPSTVRCVERCGR